MRRLCAQLTLALMVIPAQARFWDNPIIPATVAGVIAQVVVSLLTPPNTRSFAEIAEAMKHERQHIEG